MENESSPNAAGDERPEQHALAILRNLIAQRQFAEAIKTAHALVVQQPGNAEALFLLGVAQAELRDFPSANRSITEALARSPEASWTWRLVLANVLRDAGDLPAAEHAARRLAEREPRRAQVHNALGLALQAQRRTGEAVAAFRQSTTVEPRYANGYLNAASALQEAERPADAAIELERALGILTDHPELTLALAKLREQMGRRDDAKVLYAKAIQGNSAGSADAFKRLGRILYDDTDIYSAIEAYERATKLDTQDVEVWNRLGNAYLDVAALSHATRCFGAALQLRPQYAEIYDNLLLCYHYNPKIGAVQMFDAHREWARRFSRPRAEDGIRPVAQGQANRARIGLVSHSFSGGATGHFLLPLLRHIDRSTYEIFCYSAGTTSDEMQRQLQMLAGHWRDVSGDGDDELAQRIRADGIDVLIDLDGHTPGNRLRAIALKPAPIVVTWLDYFNTTGVDAVDFLIGDGLSTPAGGTQLFTEQVLRIEPSRLCYAPPDYAPPPAPPPMLKNGYVTFGSFNRLSKLAEPVVDQWARLLAAVPDARLLLKSAAFAHPNTRRVFSQRFELRGIAAHRLELRSRSTHAQMLGEYADMDIALDTVPYNGGLTTCEALWMGLPLVAQLGDSMISRQSAALVAAAGFAHWVAKSEEEWLALNCGLASAPAELADFRERSRGLLVASPLLDGRSFARKFEAILDRARGSKASG